MKQQKRHNKPSEKDLGFFAQASYVLLLLSSNSVGVNS